VHARSGPSRSQASEAKKRTFFCLSRLLLLVNDLRLVTHTMFGSSWPRFSCQCCRFRRRRFRRSFSPRLSCLRNARLPRRRGRRRTRLMRERTILIEPAGLKRVGGKAVRWLRVCGCENAWCSRPRRLRRARSLCEACGAEGRAG